MRIRHGLVAACAATAMLAAGCGGGSSLNVSDDPQGAVTEAFSNMGDWKGTSFTLRLDTDSSSLIALSEGDEAMTPDLAQALVDSFIEFRGTSGDDAEDTADDELSVRVHVGDLDAFELRAVAGELYLRAPVRELVETYDTSGEGAAELEQMAAEAQGFGLSFVDPALEGDWIQLVGLEQLGSMLGGMAGADSTPDASEAEALSAEVFALFERFVNEDVQATYIGDEDPGEHVRLTATGDDLLDLLEEFLEVAGGAAAAGVPGMDPQSLIDEMRADAGSDAAAFTMPLEVWIDGDTVARVGVDFVALFEANREMMEAEDEELPEGVEKFGIVVDLDEFTGGVDAPDDAVEVDLFSLFGQLMGGLGGGLGAQ